MSEFEGMAAGVGPSSDGGGEVLDYARRNSYWAVVGRAYWRGLMTRVASWWVVLLVFVAVMVPFMANSRPLTMRSPEGGWEHPLIRDLSRVDWILLAWGAAALVYRVAFWWAGRGRVPAEVVGRRRMWCFLVVVTAALLASAGIGLFKRDFLDVRDYSALRRAGELKGAVFVPLKWGYADQEPLEANRVFEGPTKDHWLGTDGNGRDAAARVLWGTRIVLGIGLVSEVIALVIGVLYGALMGYFVGKVDILGMRFVEIVEAIPQLFLLITFIALYGRSLMMLMVVIGLTSWTGIARFVRAEFLQLRNLDYVTAAKALGLPLHRILFRHMLPNGLTPVIVTFTFGVASNVANESILSFLGIGVEPPTPSWGSMLNEAGNPAEIFRWWLAIAPGLMIFLTVFAYNTIGEGVRDAIDPKMNKIE